MVLYKQKTASWQTKPLWADLVPWLCGRKWRWLIRCACFVAGDPSVKHAALEETGRSFMIARIDVWEISVLTHPWRIRISLSLCFSFCHLHPKRFSLLSQPWIAQPLEVKGQTLKEKLVYWHNKTWQFIWCSITQCSNLPHVCLSISQIPREGERQKLYKWEIYHGRYHALSADHIVANLD